MGLTATAFRNQETDIVNKVLTFHHTSGFNNTSVGIYEFRLAILGIYLLTLLSFIYYVRYLRYYIITFIYSHGYFSYKSQLYIQVET